MSASPFTHRYTLTALSPNIGDTIPFVAVAFEKERIERMDNLLQGLKFRDITIVVEPLI